MRWPRLKARVAGSTLARQTLGYAVSNGIATAILAAVGPILTHFLTPSDYGISSLFMSAFGFLMPLAGLGATAAIRRRYYQQDQYDFATYVWSSLWVSIAQVLLLTLGLAASYSLWSSADVAWPWVLTFAPWLAGRYFMTVGTVLHQVRKSPFGVGVLSWTQSLLTVAVTLVTVVGMGWGWEGRVAGHVTSCAVAGAMALVVTRRVVGSGPRWSSTLAWDAIRYGAPGVPYSLLDRWMQYGDRMLIAALVGIEQTGLYALGTQLTALTLRIGSPLNMSWQPWLFERLDQGTAASRRRVVLAFYAASGGFLVVAIAFWLGVKWLFPLFIGERYAETVRFLPWLCLGVALRGIANLLSGLVLYAEATGVLTRASVIVVVFHVPCAAALVMLWGPIGGAIASFLAYAVRLAVVWLAARRLVPLPGL